MSHDLDRDRELRSQIHSAGARVALAISRSNAAAELAARQDVKQLRVLRELNKGVPLTRKQRQELVTALRSAGA